MTAAGSSTIVRADPDNTVRTGSTMVSGSPTTVTFAVVGS
jgi:hypothetical protein